MKLPFLNLALLCVLGILWLSNLVFAHKIDYRADFKSVRAIITAYSKAETCPNEVCITASGNVATTGMIACPRAIPFETRVLIDGQEYECADRTHIRFDGRYDIWHESYEEAVNFGIKTLTVVVK